MFAMLLRHAMAAMERSFWQQLGALRTPTLTPRPALLIKAKMRRGGTASREALPRRPTLQQLRKVEEEECVEEREGEDESGNNFDSDFGPLLGALLID